MCRCTWPNNNVTQQRRTMDTGTGGSMGCLHAHSAPQSERIACEETMRSLLSSAGAISCFDVSVLCVDRGGVYLSHNLLRFPRLSDRRGYGMSGCTMIAVGAALKRNHFSSIVLLAERSQMYRVAEPAKSQARRVGHNSNHLGMPISAYTKTNFRLGRERHFIHTSYRAAWMPLAGSNFAAHGV